MSIANLAAQFCARSTKTVNAATIDDEIKVQVAALDAFDQIEIGRASCRERV